MELPQTAVWPDEALASRAPRIATDVGELLADQPRWVHRRSETVTFNDETSLRRHTSLYFEYPRLPLSALTDLRYVLLGLVDKELLTNLEVRDESGTEVPVLTRTQNALIASLILRQQASEALQAAGASPVLYEETGHTLSVLAGVTAPEPEPSSASADEIEEQARIIAADAVTRPLIELLRRQFLLIAPASVTALEPRVFSFAYDAPYISISRPERTDRPLALRLLTRLRVEVRDLLEVLGVVPFRTGLAVTALSDAGSYHVELVIPDELYVAQAELWQIDDGHAEALASGSGGGRIHLYARDRPQKAWAYVTIEFVLRPDLTFPVLLLSAVTTATLAGGVLAHAWGLTSREDTVAALIVALPAFFAPAVVPGTHRLVRRMSKGLRGLVIVEALTAFVAAAVLTLDIPPTATLTKPTIWKIALCVSFVGTLLASVSLWRSFRRFPRPVEEVR
jgi:hypothetical protein